MSKSKRPGGGKKKTNGGKGSHVGLGASSAAMKEQSLIMHLSVTKDDQKQQRNLAASHTQIDPQQQHQQETEDELLSYDPCIALPKPYDQDGLMLHASQYKALKCQKTFDEGGRILENVAPGGTLEDVVVASVDGGGGATGLAAPLPPNEVEMHIGGCTTPSSSEVGTVSIDCKSALGTTVASTATRQDSTVHAMMSNQCWWCCHGIGGRTYSMPISKINDRIRCVGSFCTPECVVAFIHESGKRYGNSLNMYTLLHEMLFLSSAGTGGTPKIIKKAPPREILRIFGGSYTIDRYRELCANYSKDVRVYNPPTQPLTVAVEECDVQYEKPKAHQMFNRVSNHDRVEKAAKELRLRRAKRQSTENTLESFMNLRIKEPTRDGD